ncbi:MAG: hypothetical protein CL887_04875 [Dehalococcoidia bacterium]|nr:hypothetical protein [Dehalococcoidia bacterium]
MMIIDKKIDNFLSQTLVAVLATVDDDGLPCVAPIWFTWENKSAVMFTGSKTRKWINLSKVPYASLCVDWRIPPYKSVIISGHIEKINRPIYDLVYGMAMRYYGEKDGRDFAEGYKYNNSDVVVFQLKPDKIASYLD